MADGAAGGAVVPDVSKEPESLYGYRMKMAEIAKDSDGDPESAHSSADEVLIEALRYLAKIMPPKDPTLWPREAEDLIRSWDRVSKWYA
jgi:hypothetical protein